MTSAKTISNREPKKLFIKSSNNPSGGEFAEYILADLISQGYEGQNLLAKFKENLRAIRPAVQKLINEADTFAKSGEGRIPMNELFGEVE